MDIRMPRVDGIVATRRIAARPDLASVHVVILTTFDLDEYVFDGWDRNTGERGREASPALVEAGEQRTGGRR